VITPVVVMTTAGGDFHLVDGFKRVGLIETDTLLCTILPTTTSPLSLALLVYDACVERLNRSFVDRARFLAFAQEIGTPREEIIQTLLPLCGMEPNERVLRKVEKGLTLPAEILDYGAGKNFSLKQLLSFLRAPQEALDFVFSLRPHLPLSASLIDELCGRLTDHLRATGASMQTFSLDERLVAILASDDEPRKKTARLRGLMAELRMPTLTRLNSEMDAAVVEAGLPKSLSLSWDRTLERRELTLTITGRHPEECSDAIDALSQQKELITEVFKNL